MNVNSIVIKNNEIENAELVVDTFDDGLCGIYSKDFNVFLCCEYVMKHKNNYYYITWDDTNYCCKPYNELFKNIFDKVEYADMYIVKVDKYFYKNYKLDKQFNYEEHTLDITDKEIKFFKKFVK